MRYPIAAILVGMAVACGSSKNGFDGGVGWQGDATVEGSSGSSGGASSGGTGSSSGSFGDGNVGDGGNCTPPQVLIVLDHTDSMSDTPNGGAPANTDAGHAKTKWVLATEAIKAVVAPPADTKLAFGLELFPLDPQTVTDAGGTGKCETLTALLGGTASTNTQCQPAEIPIGPAAGNGNAITTFLDPETVRLCVSTPIALALGTAEKELKAVAQPGVAQYVMLVTDGAETCKGNVVAAAQTLAGAGVKTFVVGFGAADAGSAGVDSKLLDQVACAGETAIGFPAPCSQTDAGYTATSTAGAPIFYLAEDGASLQTTLQGITSKLCCGCAQ
ncbi:MAG TPA: vWA domain-containing protein [Polyangiaceae bacterium]